MARDPNRLDSFYDNLKVIHKKYFPDLRFGQFMSNFFGWLWTEKSVSLFFPEEPDMLDYLQEYASKSVPFEG